jgi:hypothetical protein
MGKQTAHLFASIPLLMRRVASYDVTSVGNLMSQADLLLAIDSEGGTIAMRRDSGG